MATIRHPSRTKQHAFASAVAAKIQVTYGGTGSPAVTAAKTASGATTALASPYPLVARQALQHL